jgi:hypothetical protein
MPSQKRRPYLPASLLFYVGKKDPETFRGVTGSSSSGGHLALTTTLSGCTAALISIVSRTRIDLSLVSQRRATIESVNAGFPGYWTDVRRGILRLSFAAGHASGSDDGSSYMSDSHGSKSPHLASPKYIPPRRACALGSRSRCSGTAFAFGLLRHNR